MAKAAEPKRRRRYGKLSNIQLGRGTGVGVGGVDHPASLAEGWEVMKASGETLSINEVREQVLERAQSVQKNHRELLIALERARYLSLAPDRVKEAINVLKAWLMAFGSETDEDDQEFEEDENMARSINLELDSLPEDIQKAMEPILESLAEFTTPDPEENTITVSVGDTPVTIQAGEPIEKHRGIAMRRFARLEAAMKGLRELFEEFGPAASPLIESIKENEEMATEETIKDVATEETPATVEETEEVEKAVEETPEVAADADAEAEGSEAEESLTASVLKSLLDETLGSVKESIEDAKNALEEKVTSLEERVEAVEKARGVRKSLDGQDGGVTADGSNWGLFKSRAN